MMCYERIRNLREDHDLTQTQVARILHIEQRTYSHYELGDHLWKPELLVRLALYYDTSIDYLLNLTDEKKPYPRTKQSVRYATQAIETSVADTITYGKKNRK